MATSSSGHRMLPLHDAYARTVDDPFIDGEVARGAWRPHVVPPHISGLSRPMTIFLAERRNALIKWAWHGDERTFCPPTWADAAIGSGACGFGCRSCFLMLTFRALRDPLRPVVYDNGDDFEREVCKWLAGDVWWLTMKDGASAKKKERRVARSRPRHGAIGLGIDCADSLLWEGITGHARRLIPVFTSPVSNPRGMPLILLTKSSNTHYLTQIPDVALRRVAGKVPNIAVTMSLNPERIADLWEGKFPDTLERITPPIARRLEAMRMAQDLGFEVRMRLDPILTPLGWETMYREFFADVAHRFGLRPTMITLGTYREKTPQLDVWRDKWGLPAVEYEVETGDAREGTHFHVAGRNDLYRAMTDIVVDAFSTTGHLPWVSLCKEPHQVRKATGLLSANCNCLPETPSSRGKDGRRYLEVTA